jgi:hypothetical protein
MDESQLLKILGPMMGDFKQEVASMRAAGASQADIDAMLDRLEELYAPNGDEEGKLVMSILRQAAQRAGQQK